MSTIYKNTEYNHHDDIYGRKYDEMCTKWSLEDMKLKMVLLGGFLEQYFMSIHNELVRSVCEEIFMSDPIIIENGVLEDTFDDCDSNMNNIESSWESEQELPSDDEDLGDSGLIDNICMYLDEVHVNAGLTRSGNGNIFENSVPSKSVETYVGLPYIPIVACHPVDEQNEPISSLELLSGQNFNGIGAVATGHFKFPENVKYGSVSTNHTGEMIRVSQSIEPASSIDFNILFQRPGEFQMVFTFTGESKRQYQKIVKVKIVNNLQLDVEFNKLVAKVKPMNDQVNPWSNEPVAARYMFARSKEPMYQIVENDTNYQVDLVGDYKYSQFIPLSDSAEFEYQDAPYKSDILNIQWESDVLENTKKAQEYYAGMYVRTGNDGIQNPDGTYKVQPTIGWVQVMDPQRAVKVNVNENLDFVKNGKHWRSKVFIPELHKLEKITKDVESCYPIVCTPVIYINVKGETKKVPYSYYVDAQINSKPVWEFYSVSKAKDIAGILFNIQEPMMLWSYSEPIPEGYYKVTFRCNYDMNSTGLKYSKMTNFKIKKC